MLDAYLFLKSPLKKLNTFLLRNLPLPTIPPPFFFLLCSSALCHFLYLVVSITVKLEVSKRQAGIKIVIFLPLFYSLNKC